MSEPTKGQIEEAAIKLATSAFPDLHPNSIGYIVHASGKWTNASKWHLQQLAKITGERDEALRQMEQAKADRNKIAMETRHEYLAKIAEIGKERDLYKETLQWYADFGGTTAIEYDLGQRAEKALKSLNPTTKDAQ